ncbi:MAG: hypothetical protein NWF05_12075 [Candidatus Bathyarchaeota archaeon]|nr:hypothetical protein [Candidatus Bathyarchaeota archaeon]
MENEIQTLTRLGLTEYQGKTFLTLTQSTPSTAKALSKMSNVPRGKIYDVLSTLQDIGLVKRIISTPATFEAVPLCDAISYLLQRKAKNLKDLRKETTSLLRNHIPRNRDSASTLTPNFTLLPKKEAAVQYMKRYGDEAEISIDLVTSWKRLSEIFSAVATEDIRKISGKGLRIRIVVQEPLNHHDLNDMIKPVWTPTFQYRTVQCLPPAIIILFDKKHVMICTDPENRLKESSNLVTDNKSFVALAECYFEKMWNTSQPDIDFFVQSPKPTIKKATAI